MRPALQLLALCLLGAGCKVDIDFANTRFQCTDGACPDGYVCVEAVCVLSHDGGAGDGDGGGDQADASLELQTCDDQFGASSTDYTLCAETADSCEFFHATNDGTQVLCSDVCEMFGATCVQSYDGTAGATPCMRDSAEEGCAVIHSSQICICSRTAAAAN